MNKIRSRLSKFQKENGIEAEENLYLRKLFEENIKYKKIIDKIKEELKKHKYDLDYEPWSIYKISGKILFDIVRMLEEIE